MVQKYYKPVSSIVPITVTIANGATASGEFDIGGGKIVGVTVPTMTGTTFTFTTSDVSGGTFEPYRNSGNTVLTTTFTAGSRNYYDPYAQTSGLSQFCKIVSGSTEGAARTLTVYVDTNC